VSPHRLLIIALTFGSLVAPLAVDAQLPGKVVRIGILSGASPRSALWFSAFTQTLGELGYVEGQTLVIEFRNAEGKPERLAGFAAELVRLPVDIIATSGTAATEAAKLATATVPIVQGSGGDLLAAGLVASLARPGGNLTGLSFPNIEVGGKRLQLLKEVVPKASRVAVLWNATNPAKGPEWQDTQKAARALGVTLQSAEVRGPEDFDRAFAAIVKARPEALVTFAETLTIRYRKRITDFAIQNRLPMISEVREFAEAGGLITYGPSIPDSWRRAAAFVDKLLKGARPADFPVEEPTKFELVVNLRTARVLALTIPQSVLLRADQITQ